MAYFQPFAALRPTPDTAAGISCPPYDVLTTEQAAALCENHPLRLLHATMPEIAGPAGLDELARRGADFLGRLASDSKATTREESPCFYIYEQSTGAAVRTGFFGCVHTDDYERGVLVRHELTRPAKVEERTRHILAQQAHAEPVMLVYRNTPAISALIRSSLIDAIPLFDFKDEEGVRNRLFVVHPETNAAISEAFAEHSFYIADGHHRCHAAWEAAERLDPRHTRPDAEFRRFPAVILPHDEAQILAYNRVLMEAPSGWAEQLQKVAPLQNADSAIPDRPGEVRLGTPDGWFRFDLPTVAGLHPLLGRVDAERLQKAVMEPIFGVTDIRNDPRIGFVGGPGSVSSMQTQLDEGRIALAFSLWPVQIQDLLDISDAGMLMPPKSTWFEPKLRTGLLIHTF